MAARTMRRRLGCRWRARLLSVLLLGGSAFAQSTPDAAGSNPVHIVDIAHPSFTQRIDLREGDPATFDFVRISIIHVANPQHIGVLFEVHFLADDGSRIRLGSFSLFPPDNPGQFIVATQHQVRSPGSIVLSLRTAQPVDASAPLAVSIGNIALIKSH